MFVFLSFCSTNFKLQIKIIRVHRISIYIKIILCPKFPQEIPKLVDKARAKFEESTLLL